MAELDKGNPIIDSPLVTFLRPIIEIPKVKYDSVIDSSVAEKFITQSVFMSKVIIF